MRRLLNRIFQSALATGSIVLAIGILLVLIEPNQIVNHPIFKPHYLKLIQMSPHYKSLGLHFPGPEPALTPPLDMSEFLKVKNGILYLLVVGFFIFTGRFIWLLSQKISNHSKASKLDFLTYFILFGTVFSFLIMYFYSAYLNLQIPYNSFLIDAKFKFTDFYDIYRIAMDLNPYARESGWGGYLPLTYIAIYPFTLLSLKWGTLTFLASSILAAIWIQRISLFQNEKNLSFQNLTTLLALSILNYPFLFCFDRGNLEILVFIFTGLFFFFYSRNKLKLSVIFLSVAICMKGFPVLFSLLYLNKRQWKNFFYTGFLSLFLSIVSIMCFSGTLSENILGWMQAVDYYKEVMIYNGGGWEFGTTLYSAAKILERLFFNQKSVFDGLTGNLSSLGMIGAILYTTFTNEALWKKTTVLFFTMLLLTKVSADYRLLYILIPINLYILDDSEKANPISKLFLILFGLLLIPKSYYYFYNRISTSVLITPILLLTGLCSIYWDYFLNKTNFLRWKNETH